MIRWNDEMKRVIKENFPQKTRRELAELLGVSINSIEKQIVKLGLTGLAKTCKAKPVLKIDMDSNIIARYESVHIAAVKNKCTHSSILYRIRTNSVIDGSIMFRFENKDDEKHNTHYYKPKGHNKNKELDPSKFRIVNYEVRNVKECITPCPFRDHPKPMVGSAGCMKCTSFRGKNRESQQVACNRHYI